MQARLGELFIALGIAITLGWLLQITAFRWYFDVSYPVVAQRVRRVVLFVFPRNPHPLVRFIAVCGATASPLSVIGNILLHKYNIALYSGYVFVYGVLLLLAQSIPLDREE